MRKFHIVEGLEKAPEAFSLLFNGGNTGKLFVLTSSRYRISVLTHWNFRVVHVSGPDAKL